MKVFVAICFIAFVAVAQALTNEDKAILAEDHKVCVAETKVSEEIVEKVRAGSEIEDAAFNNYIYCMFKKIGFINEKDEVQEDQIKAKGPGNLTPELFQKVLDTCSSIKEKTIQETAHKLYACYVKTSEKRVEF